MRTIDLTPTWREIAPSLTALIHEGETFQARETGRIEMHKMAKLADIAAELAKHDYELFQEMEGRIA
jgi:hypothetical protein